MKKGCADTPLMDGKNGKRRHRSGLNVSERLATESFFLVRKTERKGCSEIAYENQYENALMQAPCFNLSSCGKTIFTGGEFKYRKYGIANNNIWKFHYITEGTGLFSCDGKEYMLEKGDIFLDPFTEDFVISVKPGETMQRVFFDFTGGLAESFFLTPEITGYSPVILSQPQSSVLLPCFEELLALGEANPPDASFTASKIIYSFVIDLGRLRKHASRDIRYKLYSILEPLTFKKYDLDALAESAGMSRRTLNRFFLKNMGMTPVEYIRIQKINFAAHALKTTGTSISELARMLAYSSQSFFSRDFRLIMKVSPTEYRQKYGK